MFSNTLLRRQAGAVIWFLCLSFVIVATLPMSSPALRVEASVEGLKITVTDANGRLVAGAAIKISGETLAVPLSTVTDAKGTATLTTLPAGTYTVEISAPGFKEFSETVAVKGEGSTDTLAAKLEVAPTEQTVTVAANNKLADPVYTQLRAAVTTGFQVAPVEGLQFKRDVGLFALTKGKLYLLPETMNRNFRAIYVGQGTFTLTPELWQERKYLKNITKAETFSEEFTQLVILSSDGFLADCKKKLPFTPDDGSAIKSILEDTNTLLHKTLPRGIGGFRGNDNFEAQELAALYWPQRPTYFHAFIKGTKNKSLWYGVDRSGFFPTQGPEEVGLVNYDDSDFALLYHAHATEKYARGTAVSTFSHNVIDVLNYTIEAVISKETLTATAAVAFRGTVSGPRVLTFGLEPRLRVNRVTDSQGTAIPFIQESEKNDGAFSVILPTPIKNGVETLIKVSYEGKGVVTDAGGGNYFVGLRTSWYPSYGDFKDYALYEMTFKSPKKYSLVATGKMEKQSTEGDFQVTTWKSPQPMVVAGFNFALYKKKSGKDANTDIDIYATERVPDFLRNPQQDLPQNSRAGTVTDESAAVGELTPSRLANDALVQTQNALRLYNHFFGEYPYGQIAISQQPAPNFGQAWPMLVYLPITAFFDKTQLFFLTRGNNQLGKFIDVVGPHELAHQWWGHMVVWSSYHDQWLSEGFADFSAALYLEQVRGLKRANEFWEEERRLITEKNRFGLAPADVGPLWYGLRLDLTQKTSGTYRRTVYPKGAYVLHMLRRLMWDPQTGDQKFIEMMHDFTSTYRFKPTSTENFKTIAEKHMTPAMNLQGNGKLDWFFLNWVYGTEVPEFGFSANVADAGDGKFKITGTLTQANVHDKFAVIVPIYAEMEDEKYVLLGRLPIIGNATQNLDVTVPLTKKPKRILINAFHDVLGTNK
ncbi:MAG: carboxypeptidase regulatory-like domain-containing protein [Blastocatellia bacterium]|nr:carboxypeptidase regulatory-like domain-containing protein [Blastocatellia bacterium]